MSLRAPVEIELRPIDRHSPGANGKKYVTLHRSHPTHPTPTVVSTSRPGVMRVVGVVSFYIITSISMVMINKMVLRQIGLPMTFLWGQLLVAALILRLGQAVRLLTLPTPTLSLLRVTAPLIAINVVGLVLNTLCLQHLDAVLYQVARSLILPLTVALSPLLGQRISGPALGCCFLITAGFVVGIWGERALSSVPTISTTGVIFGVLSSASTAIHSFVIKSSFSKQQPHASGAFDLVYLNNVYSAIFLAPFLLLEHSDIGSMLAGTSPYPLRSFMMGTLLAGAAGLLINFAGFLQIKVTSPVTHTVSSAARGVLQTVAANMVLGEVITTARSLGITITLLGSCAYSLVKTREATSAASDSSNGGTNSTSSGTGSSYTPVPTQEAPLSRPAQREV